MSGSYLLDTSIVVLSLKPNNAVDKKLAEAHKLYVSSVTLGELYYGAERSSRRTKNIAEVDELQQHLNILNIDALTAKVYGVMKRGQEKIGFLLPENDLWIAATAIQYNLTLAARDHHFSWIRELSFEAW
jgi:tRNA(fMet)-specific endonuclease VapC